MSQVPSRVPLVRFDGEGGVLLVDSVPREGVQSGRCGERFDFCEGGGIRDLECE